MAEYEAMNKVQEDSDDDQVHGLGSRKVEKLTFKYKDDEKKHEVVLLPH